MTLLHPREDCTPVGTRQCATCSKREYRFDVVTPCSGCGVYHCQGACSLEHDRACVGTSREIVPTCAYCGSVPNALPGVPRSEWEWCEPYEHDPEAACLDLSHSVCDRCIEIESRKLDELEQQERDASDRILRLGKKSKKRSAGR